VAYWLATGELPRYMRNLCGNKLCVKPSHWWHKDPSGRFRQKPRRAVRGRLRQLPDSEIRRIRLLDSMGSDEDEIGKEVGLTKRQVAAVALGRVRPEAGGRIRSSRHRGIREYHAEFEQELQSLRPDPPVISSPPMELERHVVPPSVTQTMMRPGPPGGAFPFRAYGQERGGRRPPRRGRW
jgi:hypothetical protein